MRRRLIRCTECGGRWPARSARFCGRCGAELPAGTSGVPPRVRAGARVIAAIGAIGLVAATAVWAWPQLGVTGSDEVRLAEADAEADAARSQEELDDLRRQIDPDRLRCEPRGCERWRYDLADVADLDVGGDFTAVVDTGHVVTVHGGGRIAWSREVIDIVGNNGSTAVLHASGTDVVVAGRGAVARVDMLGRVLWRTHLLPIVDAVEIDVLDGIVLVQATGWDSASNVLFGIDREDGRIRWEQEVVNVHDAGGDTVLVATQEQDLAVLDVTSGEPRWAIESYPGRAPTVFGDWITISDSFGHQLHDVEDGELVSWLNGVILAGPLEVSDGGWVTIVGISDRDRANWTPQRRIAAARVIGLDADGTVRWSRNFDAAGSPRCCTRLFLASEDLLTVVTEGERLELEPISGEVRSAALDDGDEVTWITDGGAAVTSTRAGARIEEGGRSMTITSPDFDFLAEGPWVVTDDHEVLEAAPLAEQDTASDPLSGAGGGE